jgi:DNA transformation protein
MDPDFIRELFAPFRPTAAKRMFGGIGLYADGLMFGLIFDGVIYLRVDDRSSFDHGITLLAERPEGARHVVRDCGCGLQC